MMPPPPPFPNEDGDEVRRHPQYRSDPGELLPRPDPSVLTTQLVERALAAYREVVDTRLAAADQAVRLVASDVERARTQVDATLTHVLDDRDREFAAQREIFASSIKNVYDVTLEKFAAVDTRFQERDTRTQQAADESRISLDAALAAAKEAVSEQNKANTEAIRKSELATQKQIDSLVALMATANKAADDKIADLKERLDRAEGRGLGIGEQRSDQRLNIGQIILVVSVLAAIAGLVIAVVMRA